MRVLLIEDDSATAQSIDLMLQSEGFNVYTTDLGEEGADLGKIYDYDIILLDINLPDMSGYEVLKTLRVSKVKTPILILSGLAGIDDKVRGLGFGADDYMTKPFSPAELIARIRAIMRRSKPETVSEALTFEDINMDLAAYKVYRGDREVHLGPTEFKLLRHLMQNPGRVFSREQLLDSVWGHDVYVEPRTVDVHIRRLRKVLNEGTEQDLIRTVRPAGYALDRAKAA